MFSLYYDSKKQEKYCYYGNLIVKPSAKQHTVGHSAQGTTYT